jgi:hypothetical protein
MFARLEQARSFWSIWPLWFIWLIWSVWFNQINETNQTNQNNQSGLMFHPPRSVALAEFRRILLGL